MRAYAILHTCCSCLLKFHFNKDRCIYFAILISIFLSVLCCCNIVIWRKFQQRGNAIHQQNRAYQNQRLTKTLLFVSAASLFSWLPYAVVKYLRVAHEIPFPVTCLYCTYILNYFNSFASPIIYVSTIPVSTIVNYVFFKTSGCRWDKQRRRRRKRCLYCRIEYGGTVKNRTKWF